MGKQNFVFNDAGPCAVYWDGNDMGPTHGGVVMTAEEMGIDLKEDGHGDAIVGHITNGEQVKIEVPLTRTSLTRLNRIFPNSSLAADKLTVSNPVGKDRYDDAKTLLLKPMEDGIVSADTGKYIQIFKAAPTHAIELKFTGEQRVALVTFVGFVSQDSANFGKLYQIGT